MSATPVRASSIKDERERRRRIRESVRNYYEVEAPPQATTQQYSSADHPPHSSSSTLSAAAGGGAAATISSSSSSLLLGKPPTTTSSSSSSASMSTYQQQQKNKMDIDSTGFNATAYTTTLMRQSTLPKLLETDTVLRHSVKALDKELQDLVYSNYSKFIAAAETIKEVRSSVRDMEDKLQDLDENVEKMEAVSSRVTRELDRHRHLVDQEVATNSMLRKVQFLVMLPQIMETAAKAEKWLEAAQYWSAGDAIFTKYAEFPSFVRTQNDCRLKAEQLYAMLSRKICTGSSSSSIEDPEHAKALSSRLSALQLLASTSVDFGRLHKIGVVLIPSSASVAATSTSSAAATAMTTTITTSEPSSVLDKARDVLYRRLLDDFQEQTNDTVAHVRIDFLHRKEDLERHAKKVQANLPTKNTTTSAAAAVLDTNNNNISSSSNSSNNNATSSGAKKADYDDPVAVAEEIKSSLVDLSLALRKRYIAKLEQIIRDSFKKLATRLSIIQQVVVATASALSSSAFFTSSTSTREQDNTSNDNNTMSSTVTQGVGTGVSPSSTSTSSVTTQMKSTTAILEQALSKILDEICSCTRTWMKDCLSTFCGCIVDASLAYNKSRSLTSASSLFLLSAPDVDTLMSGMSETFFDSILDTEKTFVSIANRFLVAGGGGGAGASSSTSSNEKPDASATNLPSTSSKSDLASPSSSSDVDPSAIVKAFCARVSRKTQQLLTDFEKMLQSKQETISAQIAEALDEDKHFADQVEYFDEDKKFAKREELLTQALVPLVCFSAVARTSSLTLPKSSLAHEISWMAGKGSAGDTGDDDNTYSNNNNNNNNRLNVNDDSERCLHEHTFTLASTATSLASTFIRFSNLALVASEIRRGFFSTKFGFEATEPVEPSDMMMRITRSIRHRIFVLQLVYSGASAVVVTSGSSSSSSSSTIATGRTTTTATAGPTTASSSNSAALSSSSSAAVNALAPNFPLVAQFTRRDVVGGVRADMDRIFAPKQLQQQQPTAGTSSSHQQSSNAQQQQQQHHHGEGDLYRSKVVLRNNPAAWYLLSWPMDASSICETLVISVVTSLLETVRESAVFFSKAGCQQLQVDAALLLHLVSELKMSSNANNNMITRLSQQQQQPSSVSFPPLVSPRVDDIILSLVNEFSCSVFDRTKERAPLSNSHVEQMAYTSWKKMRTS